MSFQNQTEAAIFYLCQRTFLSLWSYANPRRQGSSKELCDVLVLCEPHVVLFSVKDSRLDSSKSPQIAAQRWWKKAIKESAAQLYGAERNIAQAKAVTRSDGTLGLPFPLPDKRIVHRVAVSLGSEGFLPMFAGDLGKGFVHVFDEEFIQLALRGLDTVSDFIGYLSAKEALCLQHEHLIVDGGEKNLLAVFLENNRAFPTGTPPLVIPSDNWKKFSGSEGYRLKQAADEISYGWDRLLEWYSHEAITGRLDGLREIAPFGFPPSLAESELVLRYMAREDRFARRFLATALIEFRDLAVKGRVRARLVESISGVAYLFYNPPIDYDREERIRELALRCHVARSEVSGCDIIVGIGTNVEAAPQGFATDFCLFSAAKWTDEDRARAESIKQDLGYFKSPDYKSVQTHEYPRS